MKMRKGFTLVELLIVIVIIGILAAAMMLSSGSATASAEASNIISNLRGLKAASVMLYADSMDTFMNATSVPSGINMTKLLSNYMDDPVKVTSPDQAYTVTITSDKKWFIKADLGKLGATKDVKDKLRGRAKSIGLFQGASIPSTGGDYAGGNDVYMVAR